MSDLKLNTPIPIDEIDFRVQSINKGGYATILAYKDARVDMNRLDAVYGVEGWQKKYDLIDGHLFCSVGIWSKTMAQWIWKQDVGTESNTEKEKGEASDAFKRACFNLGIGRELYAYPLIQIQLKKDEYELKNEKAVATWNLRLKEWVWSSEFKDGKLVSLSCVDNKKEVRFSYPSKQTPPKAPEKPTLVVATKEYNACVDAMFKKNDKTGENYSISDLRIKYLITEDVEKLLKEDYEFKLKAQ